MRQKRWFVAGVVLMLVLVSAVVVVAQPASQGNADSLQPHAGEPASVPRTDDPLGRTQIPSANLEAPQNNLVDIQAGETTPLGRTDDPQGRVRIPLAEEAPHTGSNSDAP